MRPTFRAWRAVLHSWRWRWLALVLCLFPLLQQAIFANPELQLYLEKSLAGLAPNWLSDWTGFFPAQVAPILILLLFPPFGAVWLTIPRSEATEWATGKTWGLACLFSALSFAPLFFRGCIGFT